LQTQQPTSHRIAIPAHPLESRDIEFDPLLNCGAQGRFPKRDSRRPLELVCVQKNAGLSARVLVFAELMLLLTP
jgi:hypothetical protein